MEGFHARSIQKGNENYYFGMIKDCSKLLIIIVLIRLLLGFHRSHQNNANNKNVKKSCFRLSLLHVHVLGMNGCQQNLAAFNLKGFNLLSQVF